MSALPSRSSLCSVAICSSMFHSLTIPYLYAHVELRSRSHSSKSLRPLTVLFLKKPKHAHYVRRFTLRNQYDRNDFRANGNEKHRTLDVRGVLKEAIFANSHSAGEFEQWMKHVADNHPDALLAILLPTMVRLEKLDMMIRLEYPYFDRMLMRGIAKEKPFDRLPLFPALTDFMHVASYESEDKSQPQTSFGYQAMSSKYSMLFQNFPCIRAIYGHRVAENHEDLIEELMEELMEETTDGNPASPGMKSSLTHLELKSSCILLRNLRATLKIPKALQTFIYEIDSYYGTMGTELIEARDVLSALEPQCNSLENLWLDCMNAEDELSDTNHSFDPILPLSKFKRLKNLRVAAELLPSFLSLDINGIPWRRNFSGLFPATLETLHIEYDTEDDFILWEDFSGFVLGGLEQVPRLKKIIIECTWLNSAQANWKELHEYAKSRDVDLIYLETCEEHDSGFYGERGWGMDGSIQWARCVGDSNTADMPLVVDLKNRPSSSQHLSYEEASKHFFYKWHLCHEGVFDINSPDNSLLNMMDLTAMVYPEIDDQRIAD
jgi:hypothetical protein